MNNDSSGYYRGKKPAKMADDLTAPLLLEAAVRYPAHAWELLPSREQARAQGYTGNACTQCGGVRMQIAGHCEVCSDCGSTTGCS